MGPSFRLTKREQNQIEDLRKKVNRKLVNIGEQPKKDSEILHELLNLALECIKVSDSGKVDL
tara:strand:- start:816 stop:1001 length:186 start_codon:yes stop_codon:yes gene_type:complete